MQSFEELERVKAKHSHYYSNQTRAVLVLVRRFYVNNCNDTFLRYYSMTCTVHVMDSVLERKFQKVSCFNIDQHTGEPND
jgi:hypothetical protein